MKSATSFSKRLRVAVIYGGRSGEHEVSCTSAASIVKNLDKERFEVIPVSVNKQGEWFMNDLSVLSNPQAKTLLLKNEASYEAIPHADPQKTRYFDVVFPIIHGVLGEDGSLQGLLELADLPYVGAGVLSSAICMDKEVAKRLVKEAGIPIVPYKVVYPYQIRTTEEVNQVIKTINENFSYPIFIKPSNAGSSEGVSKVNSEEEILPALKKAFQIDKKVLIEKGINAREIELSVLENLDPSKPPLVSKVAGEIVTLKGDFYSYEAKYIDKEASKLIIPADLSEDKLNTFKDYAKKIFKLLECEGMARIDFFLDKETGDIFFSEVNTLPGFTEISLYPKLWEVSGLTYRDMLTHLIELALYKNHQKHKLSYLKES